MTTKHQLVHLINEESALELARGGHFTLDELRRKLALSASHQCR